VLGGIVKIMKSYTNKERLILILAVILIIVVVPFLLKYKYADAAFFFTIVGYFFLFFFAIEYKHERMFKGIIIICFGIFFGIYYVDFFVGMLGRDSISRGLAQNLNIFSNLAIFSCAGAGGSIIANHADKSSTDREKSISSNNIIDSTQEVKLLRNQLVKLNKKLNFILLFGMMSVVLILIIILIKVI